MALIAVTKLCSGTPVNQSQKSETTGFNQDEACASKSRRKTLKFIPYCVSEDQKKSWESIRVVINLLMPRTGKQFVLHLHLTLLAALS